jgi:hypothetical protein
MITPSNATRKAYFAKFAVRRLQPDREEKEDDAQLGEDLEELGCRLGIQVQGPIEEGVPQDHADQDLTYDAWYHDLVLHRRSGPFAEQTGDLCHGEDHR